MEHYKKGLCHFYRVHDGKVLHVNTDGCINSIDIYSFSGELVHTHVNNGSDKIERSNPFEFDAALRSTAQLIGLTILVFSSDETRRN